MVVLRSCNIVVKVAKEDQIYEIEYMKAMCAEYGVPFVINDDLEMAVKYGVGVHLGQDDGSIVDAVARLPKGVLIGRSCNNSLELAEQAIADGANYVAFGAIYATDSKPEAGNWSGNLKTGQREIKCTFMCHRRFNG